VLLRGARRWEICNALTQSHTAACGQRTGAEGRETRTYEALPVVCSVDSIAFLSLGSASKLRLITRGVLHYHLAAVDDDPNSSAEDSAAKPHGRFHVKGRKKCLQISQDFARGIQVGIITPVRLFLGPASRYNSIINTQTDSIASLIAGVSQ
jgi:hypothetical protein